MKNIIALLSIVVLTWSCSQGNKVESIPQSQTLNKTSLVVLGTIQDAGFPQIGCKKRCCADAFQNAANNKKVVSLGLIDASQDKTYLFDASPDIVAQIDHLTSLSKNRDPIVDGIFITHAHIGHYTGLMYLGKEATDARNVDTYVMPRMKDYLTNNGPWSLLVERNNVALHEMQNERTITLSDSVHVTPMLVPHRDEFSETVGFLIEGPSKKALFIPDIDKWHKWDKNIVELIKKVDFAFLDATFYDGEEINNRDISQIPHPFVIESLKAFEGLSPEERKRITFIHFNHTNPIIDEKSAASKHVRSQGFNIARQGQIYEL